MVKTGSPALSAALVRMLRPLVRILLRSRVSFKTFSDLTKWLFVDVCMQDFCLDGRKQTLSRVAIMTGLSRKEVRRVLDMPRPQDRESAEQYNRASRVVAGWRRDPEFRDRQGRVANLEVKGDGRDFSELVRRYSGDVPVRALLDELVRTGTVEILEGGRVRLRARSYVPGGDAKLKIHILGTDVGHLIATIDHNLQVDETSGCAPFFQRKVRYDNLPAEILPKLRLVSAEAGQHLLEKLDAWLAANDRDTNPAVHGDGRFVAGLGIYYFEEEYQEDDGRSSSRT